MEKRKDILLVSERWHTELWINFFMKNCDYINFLLFTSKLCKIGLKFISISPLNCIYREFHCNGFNQIKNRKIMAPVNFQTIFQQYNDECDIAQQLLFVPGALTHFHSVMVSFGGGPTP